MKAAKNLKKVVSVDERGRITLPQEVRDGVESFEIQKENDGSLRLVPHKVVSLEDAKIVESLKRSVSQFKKGQIKPLPDDWFE